MNEKEIDLLDFFKRFLKKWPWLLAAVLIGAAGAVCLDLARTAGSQETVSDETSAEMDVSALQQYHSTVQTQMFYRNYMEKSPLFSADASNLSRCVMVYLITTDSKEDYSKFYGLESDEELCSQISKAAGIEPEYVSEMIRYSSTDDGETPLTSDLVSMLPASQISYVKTITITAPDSDTRDAAVAAVDDLMTRTAAGCSSGTVLTKTSQQMMTVSDPTLAANVADIASRYTTVSQAVDTQYNGLSETAKAYADRILTADLDDDPEKAEGVISEAAASAELSESNTEGRDTGSVAGRIHGSHVAAGICLLLLVFLIAELIRYLMDPRIKTASEPENRYQIAHLGQIRDPHSAADAAANMEEYLKSCGKSSLFIADLIGSEESRALISRWKEGNSGIRISSGLCTGAGKMDLAEKGTYRELFEADAAVLLCQIDATSTRDMDGVTAACSLSDTELTGYFLLN